ncbi:polysaccharide deacetylase family protein [Cohnella cholangitidis]|uniref:Polysaccharide deacetylase family protein n=1 Tax=Cohnella cholangitidis TaxID=2598458 RepID=A0A7G5C2B0_9BACL|nr:polysaccharide deacetylase family protein [Cohnella cholangitidis]
MQANPEVVKAVAEQGHEIGNHTHSHPYLTRISPDECRMELKRTDALIHKLTGKRPLTFRPPYLDYNGGSNADAPSFRAASSNSRGERLSARDGKRIACFRSESIVRQKPRLLSYRNGWWFT